MKTILLNTKNKFALVDNEDYDNLIQYNWHEHKSGGYAISWIKGKKILMHRLIMQAKDRKIQVDHIDHNPLNNQKSNLRLCTNQENHYNTKKRKNTTSQYKGVYWSTNRKKWYVTVKLKTSCKTKYLGCYHDEKEAAARYNSWAKTHYGKFARLNII